MQTTGAAGNIDVRASRGVALSDGARITTSAFGSGDAGTVSISAHDSIAISSNAAIASESVGAGLAGNLAVQSDGRIELRSGGQITTSAAFSDGGNIRVESPLALMDSGRITTAVGTGQGNGGNMELRIPTFVLHDSVVSANAFGGRGGNIHIASDKLLKSSNSSITASSQLGIDGTITLDSPAIDPTGELLPPPPSFVDAGAILAGRCGPRLAGRASSLVIVPRATLGIALGELPTWQTTNTMSCERPLFSS